MTEYVLDKELTQAVTDILENETFSEFNPLREHDIKITACMCVKTDKDGEPVVCEGEPISLKKVGNVERVFMDWQYILVVDSQAWNSANSKTKQDAMIHRTLMRIEVEEIDGGVKLGNRKPDVVEFNATVHRFGAYSEPLLGMRELLSKASKKGSQRLEEAIHGQGEK